ncbi:MAG TPA: type II toxin-antitoxin system VapC family toxin [Chloroflexota bacterium]|nr:type II toxin-antitoxin system VapC family toxin [Chloroflexota bacterium]
MVAVLIEEPAEEWLTADMERAASLGIGAPTLVESSMVLVGKMGMAGGALLKHFVQSRNLMVIPFGAEHWGAAADAFRRYGKGRHRAALNFGDCMTYATARLAQEPLLCLGNDFAQTDLQLVSYS